MAMGGQHRDNGDVDDGQLHLTEWPYPWPVMDADQYAPPGDQAVLLEAIGRATGLGHPFQEHPPPRSWWHDGDDPTPEPPDGTAVEVLGGVVDRARNRVAWLERHTSRPDGDDGRVGVLLNLAGDGTVDLPRIGRQADRTPGPRVSVYLVPDRDDKVTGIEYVRFFDSPAESLLVVYDWSGDKKHLCRLTLCAPGLYGVQAHLGGPRWPRGGCGGWGTLVGPVHAVVPARGFSP
jgi:hypothetical protein